MDKFERYLEINTTESPTPSVHYTLCSRLMHIY